MLPERRLTLFHSTSLHSIPFQHVVAHVRHVVAPRTHCWTANGLDGTSFQLQLCDTATVALPPVLVFLTWTLEAKLDMIIPDSLPVLSKDYSDYSAENWAVHVSFFQLSNLRWATSPRASQQKWA